jgi:hypothetical protein
MTRRPARNKPITIAQIVYQIERIEIDDVRAIYALCRNRLNRNPKKLGTMPENMVYNKEKG